MGDWQVEGLASYLDVVDDVTIAGGALSAGPALWVASREVARPSVRLGFPGVGRTVVNRVRITDEGEVNGAELASTTGYCRCSW